MGIEKMLFVHMEGPAEALDDVLARCLASGCFHPEQVRKLSEYSVGANPLSHNPYSGMMTAIEEISARLHIPLPEHTDCSLPDQPESREASIADAMQTLQAFARRYPRYFEQRGRMQEKLRFQKDALTAMDNVESMGEHIVYDEKRRIGRLPHAALLEFEDSFPESLSMQVLCARDNWAWLTYKSTGPDADERLRDAGFERVRLHEKPHMDNDVVESFRHGLVKDIEQLEDMLVKLESSIESEREAFIQAAGRGRFLHDAYDLRKYAVILRGRFHAIGFVMLREQTRFEKALDGIPEAVEIDLHAASEDIPHIQTPVKLKNNPLVRPFEMFVTMYGTPSYSDIDPTPFVAWTYCLLFGLMFGDLGQGFCIALLGFFLQRRKGMALGGVMNRIGVSSMLFGTLYGSVFGFEEALDWLYVGVLGLHEKPVEVLRSDMTNLILISAIALGCAIILLAILFNICTGIKKRDAGRIFLSHNGLPGLVFYAAVLTAVVLRFTGTNVLVLPYTLPLIVLPLLIMFFKEPLEHLMAFRGKDTILHRHRRLQESAIFEKINVDLTALFDAKFISSRFGRIPTDSYQKLAFYSDDPFILHPVKSDRDYIWCLYAMAEIDEAQIDAIFDDLHFERIYIPDEELKSLQRAEAFIRRCVDENSLPVEPTPEATPQARRRGAFQHMFPDGIGAFFTQSFFEMFEVLLSFVTNTMSFLRVGGFILSHAGMMSVVFTLSAMAGGGASPVIIVIGNLFVMGLEGLIVGIQALRLEFYEIFSRFFDAAGEPFVPVRAGAAPESN